jgi:hypothetical protein
MMAFEANPDYFRGKPKIEKVVLKLRWNERDYGAAN